MPESVPRRRIHWPVLGVEAAAIFLSVLLGFGVTEWREARSEATQRREALAAFAAETEGNLESFLEHAPYHAYLDRSIRAGFDADSITALSDVFAIPGMNGRGFSPLDLSSTAWKTASATGSLGRLDFATASALSDVYDQQAEVLAEQRRMRAIALDALGRVETQPVRPFLGLMREFVSLERAYLARLNVAREQLSTARGRPVPPRVFEDTLYSYSPPVAAAAARP